MYMEKIKSQTNLKSETVLVPSVSDIQLVLLVLFTLIPIILIYPVKFEHVTFQYRHLSIQATFLSV